jgi:hypothetical protein
MHAQIRTKVVSGGVGAATNLDEAEEPGALARALGLLLDETAEGGALSIEGIGSDIAERGGGVRIVMGSHRDHELALERLKPYSPEERPAVVIAIPHEAGTFASKLSEITELRYLVEGIAVLATHRRDGRVRVSVGTDREVSRDDCKKLGGECGERLTEDASEAS